MTTLTKTSVFTAIALATVTALAGCASTATPDTTAAPSAPATSAPATPEATAPVAVPTTPTIDITTGAPAAGTDAALAWEALMGPEGEYAAAASYQAVIDAYGPVEPYTTILSQELKHIDALIRQLDRSGVAVPANPYLGNIAAPADLQTAAEAWAEGEILNVELYDRLIAASTDSRLTGVFENLRSASLNNHLPLFQQAAANGGTL